jgi:hypothetical protein
MLIRTNLSSAIKYIKDDPVRPNIPAQVRIQKHFEMYHTTGFRPHITNNTSAHVNIWEPSFFIRGAVICTAFVDTIPTTEQELLDSSPGTIAIFYSVWSYMRKAGRNIVFEALDLAKERGMTQFVTMSPKTDMAEKFHLSNGATLLAENESTNNFEYK